MFVCKLCRRHRHLSSLGKISHACTYVKFVVVMQVQRLGMEHLVFTPDQLAAAQAAAAAPSLAQVSHSQPANLSTHALLVLSTAPHTAVGIAVASFMHLQYHM